MELLLQLVRPIGPGPTNYQPAPTSDRLDEGPHRWANARTRTRTRTHIHTTCFHKHTYVRHICTEVPRLWISATASVSAGTGPLFGEPTPDCACVRTFQPMALSGEPLLLRLDKAPAS